MTKRKADWGQMGGGATAPERVAEQDQAPVAAKEKTAAAAKPEAVETAAPEAAAADAELVALLVRMHPDVHEELRQLAHDERVPMSRLVLRGLDLLFKQGGQHSLKLLTGEDVWAKPARKRRKRAAA